MIVYAVQWHRAPLPSHVDEGDLDWMTWLGHDDYSEEAEANDAAREFDAAFDGAYVHRVVARRLPGPSVASTRNADVLATSRRSVDNSRSALTVHPRSRVRRPA
jgi:hypothetical protein